MEWRALTVCLLDEIAVALRRKLGKTEEEFPLVKVIRDAHLLSTPYATQGHFSSGVKLCVLVERGRKNAFRGRECYCSAAFD